MNKTLDQIMEELKAHFPQDQLEFKVGATNTEKTKGLALAYVQARAIQDRLDEVVGFANWRVEYREIQGGFLCSLSLRIDGEWIVKQDGAPVTEFESIKGGISSAFKRIASSGWGIGRYLYNAKGNWYPLEKRGKSYGFSVSPKLQLINKTSLATQAITETNSDTKVLSKLDKAMHFKIEMGKYRGLTLIQVYHKDKYYFNFLKERVHNPALSNAAKYLDKQLSN